MKTLHWNVSIEFVVPNEFSLLCVMLLLMEGGDEWLSVSRFDVVEAFLEDDSMLVFVGYVFLLVWCSSTPPNCSTNTCAGWCIGCRHPYHWHYDKVIVINCVHHWKSVGMFAIATFSVLNCWWQHKVRLYSLPQINFMRSKCLKSEHFSINRGDRGITLMKLWCKIKAFVLKIFSKLSYSFMFWFWGLKKNVLEMANKDSSNGSYEKLVKIVLKLNNTNSHMLCCMTHLCQIDTKIKNVVNCQTFFILITNQICCIVMVSLY